MIIILIFFFFKDFVIYHKFIHKVNQERKKGKNNKTIDKRVFYCIQFPFPRNNVILIQRDNKSFPRFLHVSLCFVQYI